ncbi:MAG TPA: hypothetical protein VFB72_16930 [Verrucomicrobiae bacterium]|nr:hypothetical protein [Verrucomicrobiae bacterium]
MSTAPEEFEKLQQLLKLKRHEQPPPGYFNNFPTLVINRLERAAEQQSGLQAWFSRAVGILETNPVAAGLFGMSVCGLLISGIAYSQSSGSGPTLSGNSGLAIDVADVSSGSMQPQVTRAASVDSLAPTANAMFATNPASLFDIRLSGAELTSYPAK